MIIRTHGSRRGKVELVAQERRLLTNATKLLYDIESTHPNPFVKESAAKAAAALTLVTDKVLSDEEMQKSFLEEYPAKV